MLEEFSLLTSPEIETDSYTTSQIHYGQQSHALTRCMICRRGVAKCPTLTSMHRLVSADVRTRSSCRLCPSSRCVQIEMFVSTAALRVRSLRRALDRSVCLSLSVERLLLHHGTTQLKRNRHIVSFAQLGTADDIGQVSYSATSTYPDAMAMWNDQTCLCIAGVALT